ncbi:hypothetical protein SUDANB5_00026 [Streptomyces sp. SudanB5_2050]
MSISCGGKVGAYRGAVRGMTARQPDLKLASCLRIAEMLARLLVVAPLNHVVIVVGRSEATAEAVSEGVEVSTEVAPRSVDRFADDSPEVLQRPDLPAIQYVCRRHGSEDTCGSAAASPPFWPPPLTRGLQTGPSPVDRGGAGSKHQLIADGHGAPLAVILTGGNRNDVTQLMPLLDAISAVRAESGGHAASPIPSSLTAATTMTSTATRFGPTRSSPPSPAAEHLTAVDSEPTGGSSSEPSPGSTVSDASAFVGNDEPTSTKRCSNLPAA